MAIILTSTATGVASQEAFQNPDGTLLPVSTTNQKVWRDTFSGAGIDPSKWTATAVSGTGIVPTVSGGTLQVALGTTSGDEYWLVSNDTFQVPFRCVFGIQMSQRIAGNQVFLEVVSIDANGVIDEQNAAS